ncbi:MAG: hypothetical protein IJD13_08355 [Oscillospiraceae bacterium]|nr:hypothetical protein [Oscillospiraceae bacterium]
MTGMRIYSGKRQPLRHIFAALLTAAALAAAAVFAAQTGEASDERARQAAEDTIRRAMVTCYAIEGFYPSSLDYLCEYYGVAADERFVVEYEAFGGNIMPQVTVIFRGGSAV